MKKRCIRTGVALLSIFAAATAIGPSPATASDHNEAPLTKQDASVDLTDLYIFGRGPGETTAVIAWGGFNDSRPQPDSEAVYNRNVLYTLNIDNNEDNQPDIQVLWRFAQNSSGEWGVQVENIPGSTGVVSGPVETILNGGNGTRVWSGHADEPFIFDVQGYLDTLATGTLMIQNNRSFLFGWNVTALVVEMNNDAMRNGSTPLRFWITSARK